jgi:hypothetical protein
MQLAARADFMTWSLVAARTDDPRLRSGNGPGN